MPTATPAPQCPDTLPPPTLERQDATPHGAADLAETALWRYGLRYLHDLAAYDEAIVAVSFNAAPPQDGPAADDLPPRIDDRYRVRLVRSDDGERIEALRLTREQPASGPADRWPTIDRRAPDGDIVDLGNGSGDGIERTYAFDPPVSLDYWLNIGLTWNGLNVGGVQCARASLTAVRRERGDDGVDVERRSATAEAAGVIAPLNRWPQRIDVTDLGATVDAALDAALTALFGAYRDALRATIGAAYGYRLGAPPDAGDAPAVSVPVGLYPNLPPTATTAVQIGAALAAWKAATDPPSTGAEWAFSLVLHSSFDARTPLLDLAGLVYRIG
jgi:hypothetical protein